MKTKEIVYPPVGSLLGNDSTIHTLLPIIIPINHIDTTEMENTPKTNRYSIKSIHQTSGYNKS